MRNLITPEDAVPLLESMGVGEISRLASGQMRRWQERFRTATTPSIADARSFWEDVYVTINDRDALAAPTMSVAGSDAARGRLADVFKAHGCRKGRG